ncbi:MAG: EAL domain-containing protein (putative c-di-GMP-specific phosphodiesterase class I)/ActR [Motiliproteus sp.]|jgi:EAL domain-containing protein (putative c-di-GMP-specific phosphodiesterase class I)/ActR/RegA family two-component response regulator
MPHAALLLIDDDPFQLELTGVMLGQAGNYHVHYANGGQQALSMVKESLADFELILCDLQMPDMDGIELMRHLAEVKCSSRIILISGKDSNILATAVSLARERGLRVVGGLTKPVSLKALIEILTLEPAVHRSYSQTDITGAELRDALDKNQLLLNFQPKVSTADKRVVGAECLVRWLHPERGMIPPHAFISVAESQGLIDALTERVLDLALAQAFAWQGEDWAIPLSINLSMDNLSDIRLPDKIKSKVTAAGLQPKDIVLEVTESRLMDDLMTAKEVLTRLRLAGFSLSIDDFGTGFSSLKQLQELPFTELKIDRAFVAESAEDAAVHTILEASANIGYRLGLNVVAEGVETEIEWQTVTAVGCDQVQGYYISRPLPAPEFACWIEAWNRDLVPPAR